MFIDALLEQNARRPASLAVEDSRSSLTFRNLTALSIVLRDVIAKQTDRASVGLLLPAGTGFFGSLFGAHWAGKVPVPLNFLLSPEELAVIVRDANLDVVLTVHHFDNITNNLLVRTVHLEDLPLRRRILMNRFKPRPPVPKVSPDDLAVLLYTSGTSAAPKGVELTYGNLSANCEGVIAAVDLRPSDRFLCVLPPFHVFGLTANVLVPIVRGIAVHALPRFNPAAVSRAIKDFRPTVLMAVPSMYNALMRSKSADPDAFRDFHLLVSGGEPLPERISTAFRKRFSQTLLEGYGLTETSPVISLNTPDQHRTHSVGLPLKNVQVRIVDDDNAEVETGEEGEIRVKGPSVMRGYRNRPDETAAVLLDDGWFATGDIGRFDSDGYLFITGRKKDMMIVGGENVFPREIEAMLELHEAVDEAAVIGVPDTSRGEVPLAFVIAATDHTLDETALRTFARERLAGYKVPREIRIVTELPRGPTGKVAKRELKSQAETPKAS